MLLNKETKPNVQFTQFPNQKTYYNSRRVYMPLKLISWYYRSALACMCVYVFRGRDRESDREREREWGRREEKTTNLNWLAERDSSNETAKAEIL